MPDAKAAARAQEILNFYMSRQDSVGGIIECVAEGLPAGLGDPVFDKLDALLGQAIFSIGAVKGVEIGGTVSVQPSPPEPPTMILSGLIWPAKLKNVPTMPEGSWEESVTEAL